MKKNLKLIKGNEPVEELNFPFNPKLRDREDSKLEVLNPLKNHKKKLVKLADRVKQLKRSRLWKAQMRNWKDNNKVMNTKLLPKTKKFKLGDIKIDEDIQRSLVTEACANRICHYQKFGEYYIQTPYVQVMSNGTIKNINGQHTTTVIATLIDEGRVEGYTGKWEDFELEMAYIETDNDAIARRGFNLWNGAGQEKQTPFNILRGQVLSVRVDGDKTFEEEVEAEARLSAVEKNLCYPVPKESTLAHLSGAFTNFGTYNQSEVATVEEASRWHNDYFHHKTIHVSLWFIFKDFHDADGWKYDGKFLKELAGLVKTYFDDLSEFALSYKNVYQKYYYEINDGARTKSAPDKGYACALLQLYKANGGKHKLPAEIMNRYPDLIDYWDDSYKQGGDTE
tara:strand:+ start:147 stop:1331 length:1185 start_codon:yes stop_codon:yes gene_type:complete